MPAGLIVLLLALLLGLQPITTDLYLPALPALTSDLGASLSQAQLTLTTLLLSFGVSQLVWGPLSDRFGRRLILLLGLTAYVLASVGAALAPTITWLIIWRALQGAAMGASVMCARAIVRDLYAPVSGARVMSQAFSGLGVIACLCAPVGAALTELLNWRLALLALGVFAAVALALVATRFQETLAVANRQPLRASALLASWKHILRHPTFWAFSTLTMATYGGLLTFLAASPFVFTGLLGLSKTQYGLLMLINSLAYISGTFLCRHWLARFGVRRTVARAAVVSLTGGLLMAGLSLTSWVSVWTIMVPQLLFMVGHGVHQSCGQSGAVGPFPQSAGAASALNGFLMMLCAFAMGSWLGSHMDDTVLPMTLGVGFWSILLALSAWTLVQRHGEPLGGRAKMASATPALVQE